MPTDNSLTTAASIDILDDASLFNVFYLYRRFFWRGKMVMVMNVSTEGNRGESTEGHSINWYMFVKDGETSSYSCLHPTRIFASIMMWRDNLRQLGHTPIVTPVTLPNFHRFGFRGDGMFIEVRVRRITVTAPRLEKLDLDLSKYSTVSIPSLLQL
jgi:hypothetical protein